MAIVAVVGCGGLGGYVVECLARSKVEILVIDGDKFSTSNFNRQNFAVMSSLEKNKAEAAAEKFVGMGVKISAVNQFLNPDNIEILLKEVDIVADCTDNVSIRLLLEQFCCQNNKILVHGAINGDVGQVAVIYPSDNTLKSLYSQQNNLTVLPTTCHVPMLTAALQANEIMKIIKNVGLKLKSKQILLLDTLDNSFDIYNL